MASSPVFPRIGGAVSASNAKGRIMVKFGEKCALPNASISRYMDGQQPKLDALVAICMATGCSADWLLLGKGEPFPHKREDVL